MAEVLLEDVSPNGNVQAVVEEDDKACFFYLVGPRESDFGMRGVWVRNVGPAPAQLDIALMRSGSPVANPARHCRHPQGVIPLVKERLRVVWLPEGNGAALYEEQEILAIIPPWSGTKGFDGYARDNLGQGPLAWELTPDNALHDRFADAQRYWKLWDRPELWASIQSSQMTRLEKTLGTHSNYYAIDGGDWPPKALVRIPGEGKVSLVTIGVSSRPQPNVEMHTEDPQPLRRIELGAVLPDHWPDDAVKRLGSYLSAQSNLPWTQFTWLGPGHTIPCDCWLNPQFTAAVLVYCHPGAAEISHESPFGDPVRVLWFLPITDAERQQIIEERSERLLQLLPPDRWREA